MAGAELAFILSVSVSVSAPSHALLALVLTTALSPGQDSGRRAPAAEKTADAWERRVEQSFVPRGLAKVERLGNRWALTVLCRGTHTTYLEPSGVDHVAL